MNNFFLEKSSVESEKVVLLQSEIFAIIPTKKQVKNIWNIK